MARKRRMKREKNEMERARYMNVADACFDLNSLIRASGMPYTTNFP